MVFAVLMVMGRIAMANDLAVECTDWLSRGFKRAAVKVLDLPTATVMDAFQTFDK